MRRLIGILLPAILWTVSMAIVVFVLHYWGPGIFKVALASAGAIAAAITVELAEELGDLQNVAPDVAPDDADQRYSGISH